MHSLNKEYRKAFIEFTDLLEKYKNETSLKFLIFKLDFSDYYKNDWERNWGGMDFSQLDVDNYEDYDSEDSESEEDEEEVYIESPGF